MAKSAFWLDQSERLASDLVRELSKHALAAALYTDIDRDGTEVGPNIEATARLGRETNVPVIASGGVGTLAHLTALAQTGSGIVGAIVGAVVLGTVSTTLDEGGASRAWAWAWCGGGHGQAT